MNGAGLLGTHLNIDTAFYSLGASEAAGMVIVVSCRWFGAEDEPAVSADAMRLLALSMAQPALRQERVPMRSTIQHCRDASLRFGQPEPARR